jgi:hypothetical protein
MYSVEGWNTCIKIEFKVNTAIARDRAIRRQFTPDDKRSSGLLLFQNRLPELIDEIWLGLPPEFRTSLNHKDVSSMTLEEFDHPLRDKDLSFRETWRKMNRDLERERNDNPRRSSGLSDDRSERTAPDGNKDQPSLGYPARRQTQLPGVASSCEAEVGSKLPYPGGPS